MAALFVGLVGGVFGVVAGLLAYGWWCDVRENKRRRDELRRMFREHADSARK